MDTTQGNTSIGSINEDSSVNSTTKTGSTKKQHYSQQGFAKNYFDNERDRKSFYKDLYHFHEVKG